MNKLNNLQQERHYKEYSAKKGIFTTSIYVRYYFEFLDEKNILIKRYLGKEKVCTFPNWYSGLNPDKESILNLLNSFKNGNLK